MIERWMVRAAVLVPQGVGLMAVASGDSWWLAVAAWFFGTMMLAWLAYLVGQLEEDAKPAQTFTVC